MEPCVCSRQSSKRNRQVSRRSVGLASDRRAYLELSHEFSVWLINLADTKASILAGGASVFLALMVNKGRPVGDLPGLLVLTGVSFVTMSVLSALVCLWPRVGR